MKKNNKSLFVKKLLKCKSNVNKSLGYIYVV